MRTYSLAEVADLALPPPPDLKDPERWLRRHLNAGDIRGYKTGRIWRMTQAHLDWLLDHLSNTVESGSGVGPDEDLAGSVSILDGMSQVARNRILRDRRVS